MMGSRSVISAWVLPAFLGALGLFGAVFAVFGTEERGTDIALQLTGRLAFLFFWPAYSGGALTALFGPTFEPLKRHGREFGLSFAAVLAVHLGLIGWLCIIGATPSLGVFIFFGIAAFLTALLTLYSFDSVRNSSGPKSWWLLRVIGLNYIAYAFAVDFLKGPLLGDLKHIAGYLPFAILSVAGPSLRVVAYIQRKAPWLRETVAARTKLRSR